MIPVAADTLRIRGLSSSAIYKSPDELAVMPNATTLALVAGILSPLYTLDPVPATVVMMPVETVTFLMRLLPKSLM